MTYKKKLIEVALPLEAINKQSAREKSIRHGHPSTLHLWWARRPLAACRAVLFAQLVDDPSSRPEEFPTEEAQQVERQRLFDLIERMVDWDNVTDEKLFAEAHAEIVKSCDGEPPPILDPFCGGGSIPLEAQRLGLEAHASDLNPVAVLITKALIEIPPKFAGLPPINPDAQGSQLDTDQWKGAQGLAEDVRWYGKWMRDRAQERIGHLYPKAKLEDGSEATVIAWLWARTVTCPNPACGATMPLVSSYWLSKKKNRKTWMHPIVDREAKRVEFEIRGGDGEPEDPPKVGRGAKFRCLICEQIAEDHHIKAEAHAGRMGQQLIAAAAEGNRRRAYRPASEEHAASAEAAVPTWAPEEPLATNPRHMLPPGYGMPLIGDLFTDRQLVALTTFSDLVADARELALGHARVADITDDSNSLEHGGTGSTAYADAVAVYLSLALGKCVDAGSTVCSWDSSTSKETLRNTFSRQALPMAWDFAEANFFAKSRGSVDEAFEWVAFAVAGSLSSPGKADQRDAGSLPTGEVVVSTDPPYYDNVPYADLADFFYVWLRRALHKTMPSLFSTLLTPKEPELVADPARRGGRTEAATFFEVGLRSVFGSLRRHQQNDLPMTIFYAFKQADSSTDGVASTGWETFLDGLIRSELTVTGMWPMRTELRNRMRGLDSNALASSVALVCRLRADDAPLATRKQFAAELRAELPQGLKPLQQAAIAPVDLTQAAIGPGMAVFSRYSKVVEADGTPMRVRTALSLINQVLDEVLAEQEGEFDTDTRWAIAWFEQFGTAEGEYGVAENLSRAKGTSVQGMVEAGIVHARAGKVRLRSRDEFDVDWDPNADERLTVWEVTQHLIRRLQNEGEAAAADLLRQVGSLGEVAKDLAYRLYTVCERKKWAQDALGYNALVVAWPDITRQAAAAPPTKTLEQGALGV